MHKPTHVRNRPHIPREAWPAHPHYPAQVLLLGSHESFRRISRFLIEQAKEGTAPALLEHIYDQWIWAMRSHEAYEEGKLYPYLTGRWGQSFETAEAGHHALHERDADVRAAFSKAKENASKELVSALEAHDEVLVAHLRLEEDLVIPLLLALSPPEFDEYYHGSIEVLMKKLEKGTQNGQAH